MGYLGNSEASNTVSNFQRVNFRKQQNLTKLMRRWKPIAIIGK